MPKELRAELHARFADWLEQIGAEHLAERDEIIGYHLEQAYRYRTELAPVDDETQELALRGGRKARGSRPQGGAPIRCRGDDRARRACARPASGTAQLRGRLLSELGYSYRERGDLDAAQEAFEKGLVAADETGDRAVAALIEARMAALRTMRGGTMDEALAVLRSRTEELERLGDEEGLAEALYLLGMHISWTDGDPNEVLEHGARIAREIGSMRARSGMHRLALHRCLLVRQCRSTRGWSSLARSRSAEYGQRGQPVAHHRRELQADGRPGGRRPGRYRGRNRPVVGARPYGRCARHGDGDRMRVAPCGPP